MTPEVVAKKKVFALSSASGCLTNMLETTSIRNSLQTDHFEKSEDAADADVIIVNTCGYNIEAENSSMSVILDLQNKFPDKKIIVSGCLPRINKKRLDAEFKGPVVSTGDLEKLNTVFETPLVQTQKLNHEASSLDEADLNTRLPSNIMAEKIAAWVLPLHAKIGFPSKTVVHILDSMIFDEKTFAISVSRGCLGKCNYCSIKKAKGKLVSRPLPEIVDKINLALQKGYTRIHLLADDVGCWGQDLGLSSAHLISAIMRLPFDFKLIVNYFDPTWLVRLEKDLIAPLSDPRLTCLNVPIQSGNNDILKAMDRDYKVEDALRCVRDLKKRNPHLALKTHIMVGYPGETLSQFVDSLKTLGSFDMAFPNKFGPRPGTPAEKLIQLSESTKTFRFKTLQLMIHALHGFVFIKSIFFRKASRI